MRRKRAWLKIPKISWPRLPLIRSIKFNLAKQLNFIWRLILYPFNFIFYLLSLSYRAIIYWWNDRQLRFLMQGLPALGIFISVVVLGFLIIGQDKSLLANQYQFKAQAAMGGKKFLEAQSLYERLLQLKPDKQEIKYEIGINYTRMAYQEIESLSLKKDPPKELIEQVRSKVDSLQNQAVEIIRSMAPLDNPNNGYIRAYSFMGNYHLRRGSPQDLSMSERYFLAGLSLADTANYAPLRNELMAGLAEVALKLNKDDIAIPYLEQIEKVNPIARLMLARLYSKDKSDERARLLNRKCIEDFQKLTLENPSNPQHRIFWAEARALSDDYPGAILVLEQGLRLSNLSDYVRGYQQAIAEYYGRWLESLESQPDSISLPFRLDIVERGLSFNPYNPTLLNRLQKIALSKADDATVARDMLESLLVEGKDSPLLHFIIGSLALTEGDKIKAKLHWELAYKREPTLLLAANNLANLALETKDADLTKTLELIDSALKHSPKVPALHGTKGLVLAKMGRDLDAVQELQIGLSGKTNHPDLLSALATCYENLGDKQLSQKYRDKLESVKRGITTSSDGMK